MEDLPALRSAIKDGDVSELQPTYTDFSLQSSKLTSLLITLKALWEQIQEKEIQ